MTRAGKMAADAALAAPDQSTSAVYWLGYDAPDQVHNAISSDYARDGAPSLTRFQDGLRATHEGDTPSRNTVLGHSYGSTVIGNAAKNGELANDIIRWAPGAVHGRDPVDGDFGGWVFPSDPGQGGTGQVGTHSAYWDEDNRAREGFTRIITGQL
ncbi:alpha/beta hydrolase [Actinoplanes sp. G11-F43]|uniref:alpha/beta hydrolase n=1 Tax=Actinoplanes sp. G11-F43 TaxID=3424130 RepID=UPI003D337364